MDGYLGKSMGLCFKTHDILFSLTLTFFHASNHKGDGDRASATHSIDARTLRWEIEGGRPILPSQPCSQQQKGGKKLLNDTKRLRP